MTDIRRFFKRQRVSDEGLSSSPAEESSVTCDSVAPLDQSDGDFHQRTEAEVVDSMEGTPSSVSSRDVVSHDDSLCPSLGLNCGESSKKATNLSQEHDLGDFLGKGKHTGISDCLKLRLLTNPWSPNVTYDFKKDVTSDKRTFRYQWLADYAPWLAYSATLKGALCRFCVIFPPNVHRGTQGSFIVRAFTNYKKNAQGVQGSRKIPMAPGGNGSLTELYGCDDRQAATRCSAAQQSTPRSS